MRKNITNKEYEFSSVNDMLIFLNEDNVEDFLVDFGSQLKEIIKLRTQVENTAKKFDLPPEEAHFEIDKLTWFDDGEHNNNHMSLDITM